MSRARPSQISVTAETYAALKAAADRRGTTIAEVVGALINSHIDSVETCATCGKPRNDHPYRHPFKAWSRPEGTRG